MSLDVLLSSHILHEANVIQFRIHSWNPSRWAVPPVFVPYMEPCEGVWLLEVSLHGRTRFIRP